MKAVANQQAPTVMFVHSTTVLQIFNEAESYLEEHINLGEDIKRGFVKTFMYKGQDTNMKEGWRKDVMPRALHKERGINPLFLDVGLENQVARIVPEPGRTTWYWKYDDLQTARMHKQHPLIIMSSDGTSLGSTTSVAKWFAQKTKLRKVLLDPHEIREDREWPSPAELAPYILQETENVRMEWCIAPRLVIYDEFHKIRGGDTKIHTILKNWADRHTPFKLLAMSATPVTRSLSHSLTAMLRHILEPNAFEQFVAHARTIESADRRKTIQEHMEAQAQCSALLRRVIVRRTLRRGFHGREIVKIPRLTVNRWSCKSARAQQQDFQDMVRSTKAGFQAILQGEIARHGQHAGHAALGAREIRDLALHAMARDIGRLQRGPDNSDEDVNALQDNNNNNNNQLQFTPYERGLWIGQFPNILSMRPDHYHQQPAAWLNGEPILSSIGPYIPVSAYFSGEKDFNVAADQSAKIRAVEAILDEAQRDNSRSAVDPTEHPLKKHVVIFTSAPGEAALLTAYLEATRQHRWRIEWVTNGAAAAELVENRDPQANNALFPDIRTTRQTKPTLLIGTTSVLGTGLNGLAKCAYGILFRLPWSEAEETQAMGRVYRARQRYEAKWYTLCATDGPFETMIWDRHQRRIRALAIFFGDAENPNMNPGGGGGADDVVRYTNGVPPEFEEWVPT